MDLRDIYRSKRAKIIASLMYGIIDTRWLDTHDHDHKLEKCIVFLAYGIENDLIPLSVAREALSIFVKMESLIIVSE